MRSTLRTPKRPTTLRRHIVVRERVDSYYNRLIDGMRLDFDSVIKKVAGDTGYSERTVRDILKG